MSHGDQGRRSSKVQSSKLQLLLGQIIMALYFIAFLASVLGAGLGQTKPPAIQEAPADAAANENFLILLHTMTGGGKNPSGSPAEIQYTCILVHPDGAYHRESISIHMEVITLTKEKKDTTAMVYEARLSSEDLKRLTDIIDSEPIRKLPNVSSSKVGAAFTEMRTAGAVIPRSSQVQKISYFFFFGVPSSPGNLPYQSKQREKTEKAMRPLLLWLKELKPPETALKKNVPATYCQVPGSSFRATP